MQRNLTFTAIASFLWISLGTWALSNYMCDPTKGIAGLSLIDGDTKFETEDHFLFKVSSSSLVLQPGTEEVFRQLASYLHANPKKSLVLDGQYANEELNLTQNESLGLARAEALKSQLSSYGAPDIQIRTTSSVIEASMLSKEHLVNGISFTFGDLELLTDNEPFSASDESLPLADEFVESLIIRGGAIQDMALNPTYQHYLDKVKAFLDEHPNYQLSIVGHTQEMGSPRKNADQSNAYARTVRKFFVRNGVNKSQIKFAGKGASEFMVGPAHPDADLKNNRVEIEIVEKSE